MPFLPLLKGLIIGIVIALPVGPVGMLCVRRTIFEGAAHGFVSGLGAATGDMVYCIVAGFGLTFVRDELLAYENWLAAAGGAFLLYLGVKAFVGRAVPETGPVGGEALFGAYVSTLALTVTNPVTILSFAATFAALGVSHNTGLFDIVALVVGVFAGSLLWWLGIAFGISKLRGAGGLRFDLTWLSHITGAILAISGLALLVIAALGQAGFMK